MKKLITPTLIALLSLGVILQQVQIYNINQDLEKASEMFKAQEEINNLFIEAIEIILK